MIAELFLNLHNYKHQDVEFSENDVWELGAIASLFPLNFDETGNQIKAILEKRYTDGISGFENVKVEGSKIVGVFSDIVSPSLTKKFNFSIDSDTGEVDYTQINTGNLEQSFSEYSFAAPASKSKQCKEGKSSACTRADGSVYCIKLGYKCKSVGLSNEEKAVIEKIVANDKNQKNITKSHLSSLTNPKERENFADKVSRLQRSEKLVDIAEKYYKTLPSAPPPEKEELLGVVNYTTEAFESINSYLRGGKFNQKEKKAITLDIKMAKAGLEAMPVFEGTVFRGTNLPQDIIDKYEVGKTIIEKAFVSTSAEKQVPEYFSGNSKSGKSVQYVIQSKKGRSVKDLSEYPKESEVLFAPNTKFKVLDKKDEDGILKIYLSEE